MHTEKERERQGERETYVTGMTSQEVSAIVCVCLFVCSLVCVHLAQMCASAYMTMFLVCACVSRCTEWTTQSLIPV